MPKGESDPTLAHFSIEPNRADVLPITKAALPPPVVPHVSELVDSNQPK